MEELEAVLKNLRQHKAPGEDKLNLGHFNWRDRPLSEDLFLYLTKCGMVNPLPL
jgi:hypothetical protein